MKMVHCAYPKVSYNSYFPFFLFSNIHLLLHFMRFEVSNGGILSIEEDKNVSDAASGEQDPRKAVKTGGKHHPF